MINRILAVGDSFTYGEELSDCNNAWPYLVAKDLNVNVNNKGIPAGGNTQMIRNVIDAVAGIDVPDLVVVGLTSPGRIEFSDEEGTFDVWPGYSGRWINHPYRQNLTEYINRYHNPAYLYNQYLLDIILLQNFLKANSIKYLMMSTATNEFYNGTYRNEFPDLSALIDRDRFIDDGQSGMAEWTYGLPHGPNRHFLDEGHRIVADRVLEKIKQMGWA